MPFADAEFWTAADGARLALRRERARGPARAALILTHGFGEHSGRFAHVAEWFAERGISVYALDQRGSGRSPGRRGHVARFAQFLSDIVALSKLVHVEEPGPLLLLGHSHGGLVVLRYLETAPGDVAGAIVTSPWLELAGKPPRWKKLAARLLADVTPGVRLPTGVNLHHLSTDPDVAERVRSDPLCHQVITPRTWRETLEAQKALLAERDRIAVPVLFAVAGDDRIASTPAAVHFASHLGDRATVRLYDGFFHEVLNERERGRVFEDIEPWLARVLGD